MQSSFAARHCEVADDLKLRAHDVMDRLAQYPPHAIEGGVVFDVTPEGHQVELKLHIPGGRWLVATAVEIDHRTALDRAEEKLKKQLDRAVTNYRRDRHIASELP